VLQVAADVEDGVLPDDKVREVKAWLAEQRFDPSVTVTFKGEDEEQREAQAFLSQAFVVALFLIAIILVTQFNSFYQTLLILSAVVFSTVGVLLGLLITQQPFGIVMSGVGVIALAGIVVNNNIVLIDTYNELRKRGLAPFEAVLRTSAQRLRPVLLTTVTTILGLLPMVLKINVDLISRAITLGGPSTDWWAQLASAVAGGLAFATLLTLVLTPSLLLLGAQASGWLATRRVSGREAPSAGDGRAPVPQPAE
jgi:multidrug efflux pump